MVKVLGNNFTIETTEFDSALILVETAFFIVGVDVA
jgi:hypothetical protein